MCSFEKVTNIMSSFNCFENGNIMSSFNCFEKGNIMSSFNCFVSELEDTEFDVIFAFFNSYHSECGRAVSVRPVSKIKVRPQCTPSGSTQSVRGLGLSLTRMEQLVRLQHRPRTSKHTPSKKKTLKKQ